MKAIILNGRTGDDATLTSSEELVIEKLRGSGWEVETLCLREMKVADCLGCFGCWLKTPGTCVINDDGRRIVGKVMGSDLAVWLTPVTFGGYSAELKKALDRIIPILLPYFMKINGEVHHVPRYAKYPDLVAIGTMPAEDAPASRTFVALVDRNSINFYCSAHAAGVIVEGDAPENIALKVAGLLKSVGAIA